jgi:peroxiredoxin
MKKLALFLLILPLMATAQKKSKSTPAPASDGFVINGEIKGLEDGATIELLNSSTGAPEYSTTSQGGKFTLSGKVQVPDYKAMMINKKPPYITFFLDNSITSLKGSSDNLEAAVLSGSKANDEFMQYQSIVKEYDELVAKKMAVDPSVINKATTGLEKFVGKNPGSYVAPLAIYKLNQISSNEEQLQQLFETLTPEVKAGPIGSYLAQQVGELQKSPMGKLMPDFSQADPDGKMISLSSFRGKYVLIDFWASWCGPCRMENPNVVNAFNRYKDKNFTVFGVSLDRDKQKWLDAIAKDGLTWPNVSDLKGWQNEVAQKFGISSIPQNFLLDPQGKVIGKNLRGEALESKLASVIK